MKEVDFYDQIEDYLNDQLSHEDREAYERELEQNDDLRDAVTNYPLIREALESLIAEEGREALGNVKSRLNSEPVDKKSGIRKISGLTLLKYAAVAVLSICVGGWFVYNMNRSWTPSEVYDKYYEVYPNFETGTRSGEDAGRIEQKRSAAYQAFDNGDYNRAIKLWEGIDSDYDGRKDDIFYIGISYMEIEKWDEAARMLKLSDVLNSYYKEESIWFLALTYMKTNQCQEARSIFIDIKGGNSEYSSKAGSAIKRLRCP